MISFIAWLQMALALVLGMAGIQLIVLVRQSQGDVRRSLPRKRIPETE